jgi:signal transduction histidine kinase
LPWNDDADWPVRLPLVVDIAWGVFAVANLVAMYLWPDWETVPFHFIWVSLTVLYGYRVWRARPTALTLGAVVVTTGVILYHDYAIGAQSIDELTEVPLMAAMFAAMVWHARRHLAATEKVRRVSEQNERLLEREHAFLQDASHELRTPITIALGHAELVQRSQDDPLVAEDARVVVEELQRLGRLADRLLTLASLEQPGFLRPTSVDLVPFVVELAHRWSPAPRVWRLDELDEAMTRADPDRLQLALDAIVENAVKHTGPNDVISFSLHRTGERVVISVTDTGGGIAPEELERIFERFSRSAPDPASPGRGSGLGLSIAKAVVEAHGGAIDVRSEPGGGSTFRITLPVEQTDVSAAPAHVPGGNGNGNGASPQSDRASSRSPLAAGVARADPVTDPS